MRLRIAAVTFATVACSRTEPSLDAAAPTISASAPASTSSTSTTRAALCAYVPARLDAALVNVSVSSGGGTDIVGVAPGSGFCSFSVGPSAPTSSVTDARAVVLPISTRAIAGAAPPSTTLVRIYDLAFESKLKDDVIRLRAETGRARNADCLRVGATAGDGKSLEGVIRAAMKRFIDDGTLEDQNLGWSIAHVPVALETRRDLGALCASLKVW